MSSFCAAAVALRNECVHDGLFRPKTVDQAGKCG